MNLFLKISAPLSNFCWLGDLAKIECPCKESVAGKLEMKDATSYVSG